MRTLRNTIADAKEKEDSDALKVARRFVRAVCRVFVVLASSIGPNSNKKKGYVFIKIYPVTECIPKNQLIRYWSVYIVTSRGL